MFGWFKSKKDAASAPPSSAGAAPSAAPDSHDVAAPTKPKQFVSDEPISGARQDRFNRAPFAARIADTIARRPDTSSLVVGVFGPWGDGKTSVLKMMEEELQRHEDVVVLQFNPWHFQSEDQLIRGFFATLADGLDRNLNNAKEKIGKVLKDYGSLLSVGSFVVGGGLVTVQPGDAAKGIGEAMSNVGLDELRSRIETFLAESGKRVVVLVDDIDRLDRTETHSMFKLVKLSAGFSHTSYVLAFDDEVVAAALGERYGAGGHQAGRAFLEKIIQVPLHLPPVDEMSLRLVAFQGVEAALAMAGIELKQADVDGFMRHFVDGLESKLNTPRVAKLYTNALMFALPLLKGEVNVMNLMLIEGIRVLYPSLYAAIRDNPGVFLEAPRENRGGPERRPTAFDELVDGALAGSTAQERETIKTRLLRPLFPRTGTMQYGGEWDSIWAQEQRICSSEYFKRYFSYCVPDGDVSDASVNALLETVARVDDAGKRALINAFDKRRSAGRLVSLLRRRVENLSPECAGALARAIALSGDLFPHERGMMMVTTRLQAGILVTQLVKRVPAGQPRWTEIEAILRDATPLPFAIECIRWLRHSTDREADENVVEEADNTRMDGIVVDRVAQTHMVRPAYIQFGRDAPSLFWLWNKVDAKGARDALRSRFDAHPNEVDAFLDSFVGEGWELESGLPVRSGFDRRNYDEVDRLVSADYVLANLLGRYGDELSSPQEHPPRDWSVARKFAHQFAFIHRHVQTAVAGVSQASKE